MDRRLALPDRIAHNMSSQMVIANVRVVRKLWNATLMHTHIHQYYADIPGTFFCGRFRDRPQAEDYFYLLTNGCKTLIHHRNRPDT